jgi:hypothetical protein
MTVIAVSAGSAFFGDISHEYIYEFCILPFYLRLLMVFRAANEQFCARILLYILLPTYMKNFKLFTTFLITANAFSEEMTARGSKEDRSVLLEEQLNTEKRC